MEDEDQLNGARQPFAGMVPGAPPHRVQILLTQYGQLRDELRQLVLAIYRDMQLGLLAIGALATLLVNNPNVPAFIVVSAVPIAIWLVTMFALLKMCASRMLSRNCAGIERLINEAMNEQLLTWETRLVSEFYRPWSPFGLAMWFIILIDGLSWLGFTHLAFDQLSGPAYSEWLAKLDPWYQTQDLVQDLPNMYQKFSGIQAGSFLLIALVLILYVNLPSGWRQDLMAWAKAKRKAHEGQGVTSVPGEFGQNKLDEGPFRRS